ncbi:nucleotide pyrophosphohydrolase [candidate division KSB1 bacterium]|nr:nucleotide pyrophosphohydrolase [candidate division KSB1 bacterium]
MNHDEGVGSDQDYSIRRAQQLVDEWIRTIGVRYFSELTNLGILMEEVGEVARIMVRTFGEQSFKKSDEEKQLAEELGDLLFVLICIANQTNIDLTEAFINGMQKRTQRDRVRHRENKKLRS